MKLLLLIALILMMSTSARCETAADKLSNWLSRDVLRNKVACEPPPYTLSQREGLDELTADLEKMKKAKKYDHCRAAEKDYAMTYQLNTEGQPALEMALETIHEFQTHNDFDNAIERGIEFLRLFEFSNNDSNPLSEDLRYSILESADRKVRLAGPDVDDNMAEAVLDYHAGPSEISTSPDYRYFSYSKFLSDFPAGKYVSAVTQMREYAVDSEITRQMNVAETYDQMTSSGNFSAGSARARLIGVYSIPGADQSKLLPEVICRNAEDDLKIIHLIEKIQAKGQRLSRPDQENLETLFAQFHLLFDGGNKETQLIVDFLKNTEFPKLRLLMKAIPENQAGQEQLDSLFPADRP